MSARPCRVPRFADADSLCLLPLLLWDCVPIGSYLNEIPRVTAKMYFPTDGELFCWYV